jgi:hypothetical protein
MYSVRSIALVLTAIALSAVIPAVAGGAPTISVEPPSTVVLELESFWVDVEINGEVLGVTGYDLVIDFDETLLEVLQVTEGDLPEGYPGETFLFWTDEGTPSDALMVNGAILGGSVDGPGSLVRVEFLALAPGISPVSFDSVELRDIENVPIAVTSVDGEVEILPVGRVYFDPSYTEVLEFATFWVDVAIDEEMLAVTGYDLVIDFDESLLEVLQVQEGDLPEGYPGETFLYWTIGGSPSYPLVVNGAVLGGSVGGPGSLVRIEFRALAAGTSPLTFTDIDLRDIENTPIPAIGEEGVVDIEQVGRIYIDPPYQEVFEHTYFCFDVMIDELVLGVTGYHLLIDFDETIVDSCSVVEGDLPAGYPGETFLFWTTEGQPSDALLIDGGLLGGSVDGPGSLVTVCFYAESPGMTPFEFLLVDLRDINNQPIPVGSVPGVVEITSEPSSTERSTWGIIKSRFR